MKNILKRTLATFLVVLMVLTAAPLQGFVGMEWDWLKIDLPDIKVENPFAMKAEAAIPATYYYYLVNGKAKITNVKTSYYGCLSVPTSVNGYTVTQIGYGAFGSDCPYLTEITIPKTVTYIDENAFSSSCRMLQKIEVDKNNPNYSSDSHGVLFNKKKTELINYPDASFADPYVIPSTVTNIGSAAFNYSGISDITIPDSVVTVDGFSYCNSLKNINIPDSVKTIGYCAFWGCKNLEDITLGKGLETIESNAFYGCESLEEIFIPRAVSTIYDDFSACYEFKKFTVDDANKHFSADSNGVLFNKNKSELVRFPIGKKDTTYTIPNSVTSIRYHAFDDCDSLIEMEIPNGVETVGAYAFQECDNLKAVEIANSVTSLDYLVFYDCKKLDKVVFYNPEVTIDDNKEFLPTRTVIHGFADSTAHKYAKKYGRTFKLISDFHFTEKQKEVYLAYPVGKLLDENRLVLAYNPYKANVSEFDKSKIEFVAEDKSIVEFKNIKTSAATNNSLNIYVDVDSKKYGETKITAKYAGEVVDECTLKVTYPNQLEITVGNPEDCYELDRIFFNTFGDTSVGSININMPIENVFSDGIYYEIKDSKVIEQLKYKNVRVRFELEGSECLSFANNKMQTTIDKTYEYIPFYKTDVEVDKLLAASFLKEKLHIFCEDPDALARQDAEKVKIKYKIYFDAPDVERKSAFDFSADETREIKAENEVEFTLRSYKSKYVEEHKQAFTSGADTRNMITDSYAISMLPIEKTKDYCWYQIMGKGIVEHIVDLVTNFDEVAAYQVIIADILSKTNGNESLILQMTNSYFGDEYLEYAKKVLDKIVGFAEKFYEQDIVKEIKDASISDIKDIISGEVKKGVVYDVFVDMLNNESYRNTIDNMLFVNDNINDVMDTYDTAVKTVNGFFRSINVYAAFNTYKAMMKEQQAVLDELKKYAEESSNKHLAKAISSFTDYDDADLVEERIIKATATAYNTAGAITEAVTKKVCEGVVKIVESKITSTIATKIFSGVSTAIASFECGQLMSDILCNAEDYAVATAKAVATGKIAECLKSVIIDYYPSLVADTNISTSYSKAVTFDFALKMFKELEIIAYDSMSVAYNERGDSLAAKALREDNGKLFEELVAENLAGKRILDWTHCHDIYLENIYANALRLSKNSYIKGTGVDAGFTSFKTLCVRCPVNVFVKDSNNTLVASVEDNRITKQASDVSIKVIEDEKYICLPSTQDYDISVEATDSGTMNYSVFEFTDRNTSSRGVTYENVSLTNGKSFTSQLNTQLYTPNENYDLIYDGGRVSASTDNYVEITSISLAQNSTNTVYEGGLLDLTVKTTPESKNNPAFVWSSSNESVATVYGGTVTGVSAGTATITCALENNETIKDTYVITVKNCSHTYSEFSVVKDPTCSEVGLKIRKCNVCGKIESQNIAKLNNHIADENNIVKTDATCMANAYTFSLCINCGTECNKTDIPGTKLSHSFTKYVSDNNATYASDGTKTARCDYGCGTKNTVTDNGTKLYVGKTSSLKATSTTNSVTLTWESVDGADGYRVYQYDFNKKASDKLSDVTSTSYTVKNLSSGKKYRFSVKAYKLVDGVKQWSNVYTIVRTATQPASVTKITVSPKSASVALSWTKISGVDGYIVFRYNTDTKKWITLTDTASLSYTAKSLKANTQYRFAVKGYFIADNGEQIFASKYASVYATTLVGKTSSLKATPTNNSVKLTWSAVAGANGYRVYQYDYNKKASDKLTDTTSKSYTVKNLKPGKRCRFSVKAYKTVNGTKQWSDVYTIVVTATLPNNVSSLKTVAITTSTTKLSWSKASGATHYRVFVKDGSKWRKLKDVTGTTYTVTKMKSGTKYTFAVRAFAKIDGKEVLSAKYPTLHTASKPTTPSITKITTSSGKARLYWSAVSGETGYTVYYSTKKDSGFKKYANYKANSTNGYVSGLTKGKTYYFKVRCYIKTDSGYVYSAWSAVKGVKVK